MTEIENDSALRSALSYIQEECPIILDTGEGLCKRSVTIYLVNHPNLLCDRFLVSECESGHKQWVSIDDEEDLRFIRERHDAQS